MNDFSYYVAALIVLIVGIMLIKMITGCILRVIISIIALALLAYLLSSAHLFELL